MGGPSLLWSFSVSQIISLGVDSRSGISEIASLALLRMTQSHPEALQLHHIIAATFEVVACELPVGGLEKRRTLTPVKVLHLPRDIDVAKLQRAEIGVEQWSCDAIDRYFVQLRSWRPALASNVVWPGQPLRAVVP